MRHQSPPCNTAHVPAKISPRLQKRTAEYFHEWETARLAELNIRSAKPAEVVDDTEPAEA